MAVIEQVDGFETEVEYQLLVREMRRRQAAEHPAFLAHFVHCIDSKTGEEFDFDMLTAAERDTIDEPGEPGDWFWHREILDSWLAQIISLELKARQIGITWLAGLLALWMMLFRPGTRVLIMSVNQEEAVKVIARIWQMYRSLPFYLRDHATVTKPARGGDPSQEIELTHPDGRKSTILALPATEKAGHGETAALVILDEFSRQDFAASIWKGVVPVVDGGGRIIVISTANGVSNELTGEGNFFHFLWQNASSMGILRRFLGWFKRPGRDEEWLRTRPLTPVQRAEQYPATPEEAFISSGSCWFDLEKLNRYRRKWRDEHGEAPDAGVRYRVHFEEEQGVKPRARKMRLDAGPWRILKEPVKGHAYGISADCATGKGTDFSSAHVIDLHTAEWAAEYHAKVGEDVFAKDLYYMGRWYQADGDGKEPVIAVENQGGYGTAVIIALRDGLRGRKPWRNLWQDEKTTAETGRPKERDDYGFKMGVNRRPQVINLLEEWIREEKLPHISPELDGELRTFGPAKTMPSPRAQDGTNDDRVMSAAISLAIYARLGKVLTRYRRPRKKSDWRQAMYPWEQR